MITYQTKGDFSVTKKFLKNARSSKIRSIAEKYAREGVKALSDATPVDTGLTASSWSYEISSSDTSVSIYWKNSNLSDGIPVAILLQYGHGTRNGGFVEGIDYINPALRPIIEKMAQDAWREVNDT